MKTLFTMGFAHQDVFGLGGHPEAFWPHPSSLGRGGGGGGGGPRGGPRGGWAGSEIFCGPGTYGPECAYPNYGETLIEPVYPLGGRLGQSVDRSKTLSTIATAQDKMNAVATWVNNHPDYQTLLGPDLGRWNAFQDEANNNYDSVTTLQQRLQTNNSDAWFMTTDEQASLANWLEAINGQYALMTSHPAPAAPAGAKAPAAAAAKPAAGGGPSPVLIGVGALAAITLGIFAFRS